MEIRNTASWSGILVYLECYQGRVRKSGKELISEALRLTKIQKQKVFAVAIGAHMEQIKEELKDYPIAKTYLYETKDEYHPALYQEIMIRSILKIKPAIVLIGGTYEGRMLAPGLAVEFRTGLTADCTSLDLDAAGNLVQTRPAFGGNVMASIVTEETRPQFATVRPGILQADQPCTKNGNSFEYMEVPHVEEALHILRVEEEKAMDSIVDQRVLVVAGRGVQKKEDLNMLRELAELLGGKLASSRALVEKGWMKPEEQIGLSGNSVSPEYMITCGVSGTVQFVAGMKNTKNIIAINTDQNARIFGVAHYPICADLYEVIPNLIDLLRRERGGKEFEDQI